MKRIRSAAIVAVLVTVALAVLPAQQPPPAVKAFTGARLIDGTDRDPIANATIVVRDGRVVAVGPAARVSIPSGAQRVSFTGKTVMPGIINAHGHVGDTEGMQANRYSADNVARDLRLYADYGVTTVVSLGGDQEPAFTIRDAQKASLPQRSRIYVAGPVLNPKSAADARTEVDRVADMKVDIVKIRVDDNLGTTPKMTPEVYRAVIDQSHKRGLRTAVHLFYLSDAKAVMEAGADFIAHSVRDAEVDDGLISQMKARDVCLCPTLTREVSTFVYESTPAFFSDPFFLKYADPQVIAALNDPKRQEEMHKSRAAQRYKAGLEVAKRNLKKLTDAGVKIAMGTDTGPPARFQGYFEHLEMELMADAGLTPKQILIDSTRDAARCQKLDKDLGTLEAGKWADFVVLNADPLADIKNTRAIDSVWIAGNKIAR